MYATGKMDLGAPILDVATGEESVISGGMVVAEGFDPIIITKTKGQSTVRKRSIFKPTLDTVVNESTITEDVTV